MEDKWVFIYSTIYAHKIEIVQALLNENNIPSQQVNRMDSSYPSVIGNIELFVKENDQVLANFIIKQSEL